MISLEITRVGKGAWRRGRHHRTTKFIYMSAEKGQKSEKKMEQVEVEKQSGERIAVNFTPA